MAAARAVEAVVASQRDAVNQCVACHTPLAVGETLLLPCVHTICRACARRALQQPPAAASAAAAGDDAAVVAAGAPLPPRALECPLPACRTRVPQVAQPDDIAVRLLPNLLRELQLIAAVQQRCAACEEDVAAEDAAAEVICTDCEPAQPLCGVHASMHRKRATTKAHALKPLAVSAGAGAADASGSSGGSGGGGGEDSPATGTGAAAAAAAAALFVAPTDGSGTTLACRVHPRKPVEVWCATCRRGVCLACTQTEHRLPKHETTLMDDALRASLVGELDQARKALAQRQEVLLKRAVELNELSAVVQARAQLLHTAVDDHVAALHALLDSRANALRQQVDERCALQLAPLASQTTGVTNALAVAAAPLEMAAELTQTAKPTPLPVLATLASLVHQRLAHLAALAPPAQSPTQSLDLVLDNAVELAIQQMGAFGRPRPAPAKCQLSGPGLTAANRGTETDIVLTAYDAHGDPVATGGDPVEARLRPLSDQERDDGPVGPADDAELIATVGAPATAAPAPSAPTPLGPSGRTASVATLSRGAAAAATATLAVADLGNGQYRIRYRATVDGRYRLRVLVHGHDVAGSPTTVRVVAFRDLLTLSLPRVIVPMTDDITMCFAAEVPPGSPFASDLLVTENTGHTVRVLSADARRGKTFGKGTLQSPYGVAIAADGVTALVANGGHGRIDRFTLPEGTFAGSVADNLAIPVGVVGLPNGDIIVSCSGDHTVRRFAANGTERWAAGSVDEPSRAVGAFSNPAGLALTPDARSVLVADYSNQRIVVVAVEDGRCLRAWGEPGTGPGQITGPMALAVGLDGQHVFVVDQGNHRVQIYRIDTGAFVHAWGGKGITPGLFASPCGIVMQPSGNIIVVDRFNKRLQFF